MAVKGVFASNSNVVAARKGDFASGLLQVNPTGTAPFFALSAGMRSRDAMDTIVTWFEENHLAGVTNITNNAGTGVTIVVDDASHVVAGMIFLVQSTGEYIFIEGVSGTTLTVTRGYGPVAAQATDGSSTAVPMQRIGTAFEEASDRPTAYANLGYPRFNYTQIFRNSWDVSGTVSSLEFYTGNPIAKNRSDAALFHAEDIERSSVFGVKGVGSYNGKPFRTMDGIKAQITTNVASQSTNTKWTDLRGFFQDVFANNIKGQPNERLAFCGNTVVATVEDMARKDSQINIFPNQEDYGFDIYTLRTPFGTVKLLTHPLFNENDYWTKDMLVVHPGAVEYRYLRRTNEDAYDRNGTRAGVDADYGVFTTELSVVYQAEKTGGYYTGIDTAAAS